MMSPRKILVVEDDFDIRTSVVELLESEGYSVAIAENGQVGIDHLCNVIASELPDLILLDLMMPVKDGIQFCSEKSQNEKFSKIPVIIMSADGHIHEKQAKTGAVEYLKKPINIDKLLEALNRHLP